MRIYSWNIWFRNKEFERVFSYIQALDFDILCLQEVPAEFLERLKALPYHLASVPEVTRLVRGTLCTQYSVILSRYPIKNSQEIALPYWEPTIPLRTWLFVSLMVALGYWSWGKGNRHALYADLETPQGVVRAFSVHLVLYNPAPRLEEFEIVMRHYDPALPTLLCADLNIIESGRTAILNWILGGMVGDSLLPYRERHEFERRFAIYGLLNPLRGQVTHSVSRSQLDHILVSKTFSIKSAQVLRDSVGSDHHPISVEVA